MTDWQPIETAPTGLLDGDVDDDPPRVLLWVANGDNHGHGRAAFGHVYLGKRTGARRPKAEGYMGDWKITHWAPDPEPPND